MSKPQSNLLNELQATGASSREAADLARLAGQLKYLKGASREAKQSRKQRLTFLPLGLTASILTIVIILVAISQSSLPGSWLYPVKKTSEASLALVDPGFKGTMMIRRSAEVKQLVANHASTQAIVATLADYRTEAAAYKSSNYAVFAGCRANLQQAARAAPPTQRMAIEAAISSIPQA
jgi:uncharacterized protein (DUF1330 family)